MIFSDYQAMSFRDVSETHEIAPDPVIAQAIIGAKALTIRDVQGGERPFHYSSGNFGPGYVMIKGLVGRQKPFKFLVRQFALRLLPFTDFDFIAGLVTGGVIPAYELREQLQLLQNREISYVYIRDTRKAGGSEEHVTGITDLKTGEPNDEIPLGARGVVMEELTNYSNSVTNGAEVLRTCGYGCAVGFSLLDYAHINALRARVEHQLELKCLITLTELLDAAEKLGLYSKKLIDDYRYFLSDPSGWMKHYGLEKKEHVRV